MAERTVSVKLSARVEQYIAAMRAAEASTTGLSKSGIRAVNQLGSSMQHLGTSMTKYVTVPLAALAAGSVLMASRFDTAFAQMVGLANVPADEVDHLKESVLSLAGETAQAPQDLAEALYFAASSGLDAADAMDAVELGARAAAAGMGSTQDVVGLITAAVASYGSANLSAADAADILTSTIREGRAAPDELAGAMGRVLPIAASMGVSLNQVGGALAYLTNTGVDTDLAVTELRDALVQLDHPGKDARKVLEEMGTSAGELHAAIAADGLTGALELLREHGFDGNRDALDRLMPDIRGLTALTALLEDHSGSLDTIMGRLSNTTGSLDTAFSAVSSTAGFKMKQAFTDIKVAMIEVGDILLPLAAQAAEAISTLVRWFTDLPDPIQKVVIVLGALAATAGPVIMIAGTLLKNWQLLTVAFQATSPAVQTATASLGMLALAVGTAVAVWKILDQGHLNATGHIDASADALQRATEQAWKEADAARAAGLQIDTLSVAHQALGVAILEQADDRLSKWFAALNVDGGEALDVLLQLKEYTYNSADSQEWLADRFGLSADAARLFNTTITNFGFTKQDITQEMRDTLGMTDDQIMATRDAILGLNQYALESSDELDNMARSTLDAYVQLGGLGKQAVIAAEAIAGSRLETGNAIPVYEEFLHQLSLLDPTAADAVVSVDEMTAAVTALGPAVEDTGGWFKDLWDITTDAAKAFGVVVGGAKDVVDALGQATTAIDTTAEAQQALEDISTRSDTALAIVHLAEAASHSSRVGNDALKVWTALLDIINRSNPTYRMFALNILGLNNMLGKVEGTTIQAKDAADLVTRSWLKTGRQAEDTTTSTTDLAGVMADVGDAMENAATRADEFRNAITRLRAPQDDLRAATRDLWAESDNMAQSLEDNGTSFAVNTAEGRANQEQLEKTRDAIFAHGAALIENGASAETAANDIAFNVQRLNDQWVAAHLTTGQIAMLNAQYGLTPEQVSTYLEVLGDKVAKAKLGAYQSDLAAIPKVWPTTVKPQINQSAYTKTRDQVAGFTNMTYAPVTPYLTKTTLYVQVKATGSAIVRSAAGRYVDQPTMSTLGESGAEVVLPLTNPGRMSQLLGMAEVGPRVAAALSGLMPYYSPATTTSNAAVYNVNVNMPPGSDGDDVVRALRQWQRRGGPVPVSVR